MTAVHLSTDNSEIKVVSSLKKAYSSEGVPTLNVASKVKFPKPLRSTLQSYKVKEAKWPTFHGLLAHRRQHIHQEVLIPVCRYSDFALATILCLWPLHDLR